MYFQIIIITIIINIILSSTQNEKGGRVLKYNSVENFRPAGQKTGCQLVEKYILAEGNIKGIRKRSFEIKFRCMNFKCHLEKR